MNTWLTPVFIGVTPLDPHYGRRPPENLALASGGSEHMTLRPPCPGALAPAWFKIRRCLRCTDTAYTGKAVAAGPVTSAPNR